MIHKLKITGIFFFLLLWGNIYCQTPRFDELLGIHNVSTNEMNAIVSPFKGSLIYNIDKKSIYFYTGALWKKLKSDGNETKIVAGDNLTISGNGTEQVPYIIKH